MRLFFWVGLLGMVGCAGMEGPRKRDVNPQKIDARGLSIPEQQARAKAKLPYSNIESNLHLVPRTWSGLPEEQYGERFSY